jgi:hypothetical protein
MWALVKKETTNSNAPLDVDAANALKRMWKVKEGGRWSSQIVATHRGV